jgi:hypothetical protein
VSVDLEFLLVILFSKTCVYTRDGKIDRNWNREPTETFNPPAWDREKVGNIKVWCTILYWWQVSESPSEWHLCKRPCAKLRSTFRPILIFVVMIMCGWDRSMLFLLPIITVLLHAFKIHIHLHRNILGFQLGIINTLNSAGSWACIMSCSPWQAHIKKLIGVKLT